MPIPITEHPRYGERMAEHQRAKQAAAESGDPAQIAKVDSDWQTAVNVMQNEMYDRQQAEQARAAAVAKARELVPDIPDAVLQPLSDPAQIVAAAEALKAQRDAAAAQQPPTTPPAGQQPPQGQPAPSWGAGPPTGAGQQQPDPNDPAKFHTRMTELAQVIETEPGKSPSKVEEFKRDYFGAFIKPGMIRPQR